MPEFLKRKFFLSAAAVLAAAATLPAGAQIEGDVVRIGVLADMSGLCCRPRRPRRRFWGWPMAAATPSTPSRRPTSSASPSR